MGLYLPTGSVGNGRVLATVGGAGEIMAFFFPRLDFAQNVREAMPALYVGDPGHGVLHWTFSPAFQRSQTFFDHSNLLRTQLDLRTPPLQLLLEDFCPPDSTALVRRVRFTNTGDEHFRGTFLHYFFLRLGEVSGKQAARWEPDSGCVMQYFRDIVLAVGGTRPDLWRCGKGTDPASHQSAKSDLDDGHLNGQPEDIGDVDFALGWRLDLATGQERTIELILAAEHNHRRTARHMHDLRRQGCDSLRAATVHDDERWLRQATAPTIPARLEAAYTRALLSLRQLGDAHTGAILAAPEFDPGYLRSGGYGYCWPRDASWAAESLRQAGYPQYTQALADWYVRHQLDSGFWGQRYWTDGQLAASWALREDFLQLDQCGAALLTLCRAAAEEPDAERAERLWPAVERGALAVASKVQDGWHSHACDLWETYRGSFLFTNAVLAAGLEAAAQLAQAREQTRLASHWQGQAEQMRERILAAYTGEYFPRGLHADGHVDRSVDTATLGIVAPYAALDLSDSHQRAQAESNLQTIRRRLSQPHGAGVGLRRYEGDGYLGGVIGCVNTLWAALVSLKLAQAWQEEDPSRAAPHRDQALADLDFCLAHATPTGHLPELIGLDPAIPYWAAPHSWASALLLDCLHELAALQRPAQQPAAADLVAAGREG